MPRVPVTQFLDQKNRPDFLNEQVIQLDLDSAEIALQAEEKLGYMVSSGRYWEVLEELDAVKLSEIDSLWLATVSS